MSITPFRLEGERLFLLDQTLLPDEERWIEIQDASGMVEAIGALRVRGAPAIGIAAALALALEASRPMPRAERLRRLTEAGEGLIASRPTAVNLEREVRRVLRRAQEADGEASADPAGWSRAVRAEAQEIWDEDVASSRLMARHGASLFPNQRRFLTHCNTGALATGGGGTALGVLLELHRVRKGGVEVWATETRPLLQGARLTAWELGREGVPVKLIADSAAAHLILTQGIEGVLVGADRIARNGDTANKIGTFSLALAAREAGIPFVVVAPSSTVDPSTHRGADIPIEGRRAEEITRFRGVSIAPAGVEAVNPAFDVTPAKLITAIVTERGVARGPTYDFEGVKPGPVDIQAGLG